MIPRWVKAPEDEKGMTKYKPWWELGVQALTKLNVFPAGTAACCNQAEYVCAAEVWYMCCQVQALAIASVAAQGETAQQSSSPAASQALTVFRRPLLGASPRLSSAFELPVVGALGYSLSPVQVRRLPCWLSITIWAASRAHAAVWLAIFAAPFAYAVSSLCDSAKA